jgi:hypothetical protein
MTLFAKGDQILVYKDAKFVKIINILGDLSHQCVEIFTSLKE